VGWLDNLHPFPKDPVPTEFVTRLREHILSAWQPLAAGGEHECETCARDAARHSANVWIPSRTVVYVAPAMILHYIEAHVYRPPDEFIGAVMACPRQGSAEYFDLVRPHTSHAEFANARYYHSGM
jgi:hypothetical protein